MSVYQVGERTKLQSRKYPHQIGLWACMWYIFLIDYDWCGVTPHTVGYDIPRLLVLAVIKKTDGASHGEQAIEQNFSVASGSVSVTRFLSWIPSMADSDRGMEAEISFHFILKPFLLLSVMVFYDSNRNYNWHTKLFQANCAQNC